MTAMLRSDDLAVGPSAPRRPARETQRVLALDWARGGMLIASLVNVGVLAPRPLAMQHAAWFGVRPIDLVFPVFVALAGVGLALANRRPVPVRTTVRRSLTLFACSLAYNAVTAKSLDWHTWQVTGPLTVYAALVLVIGLVGRRVRGAVAWGAITLVLAAVDTWLQATKAAGCPGGVLAPTCNLSGVVDPAVLGTGHIYHHGQLGHDPEGLVSFLGTLVSAGAGITAGWILIRMRGRSLAPVLVGAWAAVLVATGLTADVWLEPFKRQWTPPFALLTAALALAPVVVGTVLFDLPRWRPWRGVSGVLAWPLVALGRNSLLTYFGSHALYDFCVLYGKPAYSQQVLAWFAEHAPGHDPRRLFLLATVGGWWALAMVLHAAGIYVTAGGIRVRRRRRTARPETPPAEADREPAAVAAGHGG
ncbi:MAG: heparan-alpha-glucosaminide N-acetyltransferase [Motilibacteraceae bacterium]